MPALVFLALGLGVGVAFTFANQLLGPKRPSKTKSEPYECGLPSDVRKSFRFGVSFYLVAMLFILFDIELIFLMPWAVVFKSLAAQGAAMRNLIYVEMMLFVVLLLVGYIYVLKKGLFDWNERARTEAEAEARALALKEGRRAELEHRAAA